MYSKDDIFDMVDEMIRINNENYETLKFIIKPSPHIDSDMRESVVHAMDTLDTLNEDLWYIHAMLDGEEGTYGEEFME